MLPAGKVSDSDSDNSEDTSVTEHEVYVEELRDRLDELQDELSAAKRLEKELRSKDHTNQMQIQSLEAEVAKMTRMLDSARIAYHKLQENYQAQVEESERLRAQLHDDLALAAQAHEDRIAKLEEEVADALTLGAQEQEDRIAKLEEDLAGAQGANAEFEQQKMANLMLRETIDRLHFEIDEMKSQALATNTGTRTLGEELRRNTTNAEDLSDDEIVQEIITQSRKRITPDQNFSHGRLVDTKEYSDMATQHEVNLDWFSVSVTVQTDPEKVNSALHQIHTLKLEIARLTSQIHTQSRSKDSKISAELQAGSLTIEHISGGTGGAGGAANIEGGSGGIGEAPRLIIHTQFAMFGENMRHILAPKQPFILELAGKIKESGMEMFSLGSDNELD
uniref:Uncharacterized protein n=1 Tax=Mycena chlorophos TaxID=658473 RepID=A0ABQ0KW00_MYCCL|nr:predicted protein [Mycena chlorophos]